jgi:hypothetical protein
MPSLHAAITAATAASAILRFMSILLDRVRTVASFTFEARRGPIWLGPTE